MSDGSHAHVFILAGGSGERFWPLSRQSTPKHLLRLFSDETLLGETVARAGAAVPPDRVHVITNAAQREAVLRAVPSLAADRVIAEPARRDTAAAAALATAIARRQDPDACVVLLPADHVIHDTQGFARTVQAAAACARERGGLVTIGIRPTQPSTAFGYLKLAHAPDGGSPVPVERFLEKPERARAEALLAEGAVCWNAGMFAWRVGDFLEELDRQQPELAAFVREFPATDDAAFLAGRFPGLPRISLDYAIMEGARRVWCVPAGFDWDDVGSWTALPAHVPPDADGNTVKGAAVFHDAARNIVFSSGRTIALCGVQDLVVVETPDAVLVCARDRAEDIKKLLANVAPELLR
jgi:mannose-1-phosphate guanylyltransferase